MYKVLDSVLKVSMFDITFTFRLITLSKVLNSYLPSYGLNSNTAVLLQEWLWHLITLESLYAIIKETKPIIPTEILVKTLNYIWWSGSCPLALGNVKYCFMPIASRATLTRSSNT